MICEKLRVAPPQPLHDELVVRRSEMFAPLGLANSASP